MSLQFNTFEELVKHIKSRKLGEIDLQNNGSYDIYSTPRGDAFAEKKKKSRKSATGKLQEIQNSGHFSTYESSGGDVLIRHNNEVCSISEGKSKEYRQPDNVPQESSGIMANNQAVVQLLPVVQEGKITEQFVSEVEVDTENFQLFERAKNLERLNQATQVLANLVKEFDIAHVNQGIAWNNIHESLQMEFPPGTEERNLSVRKRLREKLNADMEKVTYAIFELRNQVVMLQEFNQSMSESYAASRLLQSM